MKLRSRLASKETSNIQEFHVILSLPVVIVPAIKRDARFGFHADISRFKPFASFLNFQICAFFLAKLFVGALVTFSYSLSCLLITGTR
jgi:hypothetical protein